MVLNLEGLGYTPDYWRPRDRFFEFEEQIYRWQDRLLRLEKKIDKFESAHPEIVQRHLDDNPLVRLRDPDYKNCGVDDQQYEKIYTRVGRILDKACSELGQHLGSELRRKINSRMDLLRVRNLENI